MQKYEQLAIVSDTIQSWKKGGLEVVQKLDLPENPSLFLEGIHHLCPSQVDRICALSAKPCSG